MTGLVNNIRKMGIVYPDLIYFNRLDMKMKDITMTLRDVYGKITKRIEAGIGSLKWFHANTFSSRHVIFVLCHPQAPWK